MKTQSGFADAADARLYFEQAGTGPAVLFVHAGVADLRMWDSQVEALSDRFNCIRFDMRGFGRTENRADSFSPSGDIVAILDHLDVDRAHVVGLSMGGGSAVRFALEHPDRVLSLCLVAAGVGGWEGPANEAELAELAEVEKAFEAQDWDLAVELEVQYWLDGPGRAGRVGDEIREKMKQMCRTSYGRSEPTARPLPMDPPAIKRLSEMGVPTLVIVGTFDESSIPEIADVLAEGIHGARKIVYEGAAHMINLEQPERFNSDLLGFLTGSASSP